MLSSLIEWDLKLFQLINSQWQHSSLDCILPFWRTKITWIPLYLLILIFLFRKYEWKKVLFFFFIIGLTVLLCDQISSQLLKKTIMRVRPCNNPILEEQIRLLVHCGTGYSFTSSHATNHFGLAFLFIQLLKPKLLKVRWLIVFSFYIWATLVAYAQVYVGVHYPLDVCVGAILGISIAKVLWSLGCWIETYLT